MKFSHLVVVSVAVVCLAAAQDLAPEVILIARIKSHLREEFSRLPNCICLETITRFQKEARRAPGEKMRPLDVLRLEVIYSDHHEWYGWPGDRRLSKENPVAFIGGGMIGNGAFALAPHNLFLTDVARFTYRGEEAFGSRTAVKYDFTLSRFMAPLQVSISGGTGTVGEQGSFWVDPHSLDLLRLDSRAAEIPAFLPLAAMEMTINYARTRIGEQEVLLPQQADFHMAGSLGNESYNRFEFTHCRMYHTQSAIRFEADPFDRDAAELGSDRVVARSEPERRVPALLRVTLQLKTPITDASAVGALVDARVVGDVRRKGNIVLRDNAVVHGRIRRLERYQGDGYFIVAVEFTEVETDGTSMRFYADLLSMDKRPEIQPNLTEWVLLRRPPPKGGSYAPSTEKITLPELPGVAAFFVHGSNFTIPIGFRTVWRTRSLIR